LSDKRKEAILECKILARCSRFNKAANKAIVLKRHAGASKLTVNTKYQGNFT